MSTAFPSFFGRESPNLGVDKNAPIDISLPSWNGEGKGRVQARGLSQHPPASQPDAHLIPTINTPPTYSNDAEPPSYIHAKHRHHHSDHRDGASQRTPEEEAAYLSRLREWAIDKDSMKPGDGTFYWNSAQGGDMLGATVMALDTEQQIRDTTIIKKEKAKGKEKEGLFTKLRRLSHRSEDVEGRANGSHAEHASGRSSEAESDVGRLVVEVPRSKEESK